MSKDLICSQAEGEGVGKAAMAATLVNQGLILCCYSFGALNEIKRHWSADAKMKENR